MAWLLGQEGPQVTLYNWARSPAELLAWARIQEVLRSGCRLGSEALGHCSSSLDKRGQKLLPAVERGFWLDSLA